MLYAAAAAAAAAAALAALLLLALPPLLRARAAARAAAAAAAASRTSSVLAVFGSGGHTAEMIALLRALPASRYAPRAFVLAASDGTSLARARAGGALPAGAAVHAIPRAREVGGSWAGAAVASARAAAAAARLLLAEQPALLLTNGPGTCVPLLVAAAALRAAGALRADARAVFVESACRVDSLSISGRIAYAARLATVAVQWPELARRYPRAVYVGLVL